MYMYATSTGSWQILSRKATFSIKNNMRYSMERCRIAKILSVVHPVVKITVLRKIKLQNSRLNYSIVVYNTQLANKFEKVLVTGWIKK